MSEAKRPGELLVSVVMPVYNGAKFLREALGSATGQTYTRREVIVVDDGSEDESAEIVAEIGKEFAGVRAFYQANGGIAAARNRGLELAEGELIAFLDQDDVWARDKLERQVAHLHEHPEHALALCKERLFYEEGFTEPHWFKHKLMLEDHVGLVPGTWLVRREVFERVGLLDGVYKIADDLDWFKRFLDAGLSYGVVDETLLFKRMHGGNASLRLPVAVAEMLTLVRASIHRQRDSGDGEA